MACKAKPHGRNANVPPRPERTAPAEKDSSMIYGVIDVGSNTVRLCVYDVSPDGKYKVIMNRKSMAGLAAYVSNGAISDEGIAVAIDSIRKCLKRATYLNPERVDVFATAVLRNISNSNEALSRIEEGIGQHVTLLSEEDEAHLGFVGASSKSNLDHGVLLDIGGGSSEVTLVVNGNDVARASLAQGSLSTYKRYVSDILPTQDEFEAIRADVRRLLAHDEHGLSDYRVRKLYGVGGSIRALAEANALMQDARNSQVASDEARGEKGAGAKRSSAERGREREHTAAIAEKGAGERAVVACDKNTAERGCANSGKSADEHADKNAEGLPEKQLSHDDVHRLIHDVFDNRKLFVNAVLRTSPERIHTIVCGLAILAELFDDFDADTLFVCEGGVREGYLLERMLNRP